VEYQQSVAIAGGDALQEDIVVRPVLTVRLPMSCAHNIEIIS